MSSARTGRPLRVALAAEEAAGLQVLRLLLDGGHRVAAVFTGAGDGAARGATVAGLARTRGIPVHRARRVRDPGLAAELRAGHIDLLLNVHSLFVVHAEVVNAPSIGSFNLHPGPLPRYSGLNAPSWAILRGETEHAVTVHWMEAGIDTGPIAYMTRFPITDEDTGLTVSTRCVREGVPLFAELLGQASAEPSAIPRLPQQGSGEYHGREVPDGGRLRWSRPAREVAAFIRAASFHPLPSPWGHPRARHGGITVGFLRAAVAEEAGSGAPPGTVAAAERGVRVACGEGWIRADLVRHDGRLLDPAEVLRPGDRLEDGAD